MAMYFPRYLISVAKHAAKVEPIKCLEKYITICPTLMCERSDVYFDKKAFVHPAKQKVAGYYVIPSENFECLVCPSGLT